MIARLVDEVACDIAAVALTIGLLESVFRDLDAGRSVEQVVAVYLCAARNA